MAAGKILTELPTDGFSFDISNLNMSVGAWADSFFKFIFKISFFLPPLKISHKIKLSKLAHNAGTNYNCSPVVFHEGVGLFFSVMHCNKPLRLKGDI